MYKHMRRSSYLRRQRKFALYIVFLLILAVSIVLMPIGTEQKEKSIIPLVISGVLFWIGLLGTIGMAVNINMSRRASPVFEKLYPNLRQFGLIHFFQNRPALIADVAMFVSITVFAVVRFLNASNIWQFTFIALIVFTFGMHCMLNGINYIYVKYRARREIAS